MVKFCGHVSMRDPKRPCKEGYLQATKLDDRNKPARANDTDATVLQIIWP